MLTSQGTTAVPAEFAIAVNCCRWSRPGDLDDRLRHGARTANWSLLEQIARRHRVEGLVWRTLKRAEIELPDGIMRALRSGSERIVRQNLVAAGECARLRNRFSAAGVDLLFLKGLSLGVLAYGSILPKASSDIDVLAPREHLPTAAALLVDLGYDLCLPSDARPRALERWHRICKESVWRHGHHGLTVELHTGVSDHPMLLPNIGLDSPRQSVTILADVTLETLAREELIAYLAVHGASSAWFRLKWLADFANLLDGATPEQIELYYRRSQQLGAARAADLALLLAHDLFGTQVPGPLLAQILSDPANLRLLKAVRRSLLGRAVAKDLHEIRLGTLWIHLMQFDLKKGLGYKGAELLRQVRLMAGQRQVRDLFVRNEPGSRSQDQ